MPWVKFRGISLLAIADDMNKEFEFFITELDQQIRKWTDMKIRDGSILVGNTDALIGELARRTEPRDTVMCRISGAWLEHCVESAVWRLLDPVAYGDYLPGRKISGVTVDLTTCVAWFNRELSLEGKKDVLKRGLGRLMEDPRLAIIP